MVVTPSLNVIVAEVAQNTGAFAKSCAMLANAEEHTALSRALSQLAEVEEKVDALHLDQADSDFFVFAELIKDYVTLIGSVKVLKAFHQHHFPLHLMCLSRTMTWIEKSNFGHIGIS